MRGRDSSPPESSSAFHQHPHETVRNNAPEPPAATARLRWRPFLKSNTKLSTSMTLIEFDNGYWYATELKELAQAIGIPAATKLRKDELEKAIKHHLATGKVENPTKRNLSTSGPKDVERGLRLDLPVVVYSNDKETKDFLEREAQRL